jgi:hypothetical protein
MKEEKDKNAKITRDSILIKVSHLDLLGMLGSIFRKIPSFLDNCLTNLALVLNLEICSCRGDNRIHSEILQYRSV